MSGLGSNLSRAFWTSLAFLVFATPFYLMTGLVFEEGAFGYDLVIKPRPMLAVEFGGGEDGIWARLHPGEPPPWWQAADLTRLVHLDWEGGYSAVYWTYIYGWLATLLGWPALAIGLVLWALWRLVRPWLKPARPRPG